VKAARSLREHDFFLNPLHRASVSRRPSHAPML
jgi:hypothetical protein